MILEQLTALAIITILPILFIGCGGKKKKKSNPATTPKTKTPRPPASVEVPTALKSTPVPEEKKEEPVEPPPKPPSPPKPVVQDSKVAEELPESEKVDEMKGGIMLPNPPKNLRTEGELEQAKQLKEEMDKKKKEKKEADEIM